MKNRDRERQTQTDRAISRQRQIERKRKWQKQRQRLIFCKDINPFGNLANVSYLISAPANYWSICAQPPFTFYRPIGLTDPKLFSLASLPFNRESETPSYFNIILKCCNV